MTKKLPSIPISKNGRMALSHTTLVERLNGSIAPSVLWTATRMRIDARRNINGTQMVLLKPVDNDAVPLDH